MEMVARAGGKEGWVDPHNGGIYSLDGARGADSLYTKRTTNPKKSVGGQTFTDRQLFTFTHDGQNGCVIEACSVSQGPSLKDFSTNYCDLRNLFCGSADGCKPLHKDFKTLQGIVSPSVGAGQDFKACVVPVEEMEVEAANLLVSQSSKGSFEGLGGFTIAIPWIGKMTETLNGTMDIYMDVGTGSFRADIKLTSTDKESSTDTNLGLILSGKTKRAYAQTDTGKCEFLDLPSLPEPSQFVPCVEGLLRKGKGWFKDVYTVKDQTKEGPSSISGTEALSLHIDRSDGGIRKIEGAYVLNLFLFPVFTLGGTWTSSKTVLGTPDAGIFEVPTDWGTCTEGEWPDLTNLTKIEQAWLKCLQPARSMTDMVMV